MHTLRHYPAALPASHLPEMARSTFSSIEPLESRIAPAALVPVNPLPETLYALAGQKAASLDLGYMFDSTAHDPYGTVVTFTTNFTDPTTHSNQIVIDLYDGVAPLTVANFLHYVESGEYTNTFFHRVFTKPVSQTTTMPIGIQGGGYTVSNPSKHIPTGFDIHNEANPSYPLVAGTIAMAEQALSPNTANSEFFFNTADNSSAFTGGPFTVFGSVDANSLQLLSDIAASKTADISSGTHNPALTSVPYQANSSGPSPSSVFKITHVSVTPPTSGNSPGYSFSVSVANPDNSPNLVTADVSGQTLQLHYKPGATGIAEVTVTASMGGNTVSETIAVHVQPNLVDSNSGTTFQRFTPGQSGAVTTTISNNGGVAETGSVDVKYFLQPYTGSVPVTLSNSAIPVGDVVHNLNLAPGKSLHVTDNITLPGNLTLQDNTSYQLFTQVSPNASSGVSNEFSDDNYTLNGPARISATTPGLMPGVVTTNLPGWIVPGDTGIAHTALVNNSSASFAGKVQLQYFLEPYSNGAVSTTGAIAIGSSTATISLKPNQSATYTGSIAIPEQLFQNPGSYYKVVTEISLPGGGNSGISATDMTAATNSSTQALNEFGSADFTLSGDDSGNPLRLNVPIKYLDANNHLVTLQIKGYEYGQIDTDGNGGVFVHIIPAIYNPQNPQYEIEGDAVSTMASKVTLANGKPTTAHTAFDSLNSEDYIKSVSIGNVDVTGGVNFAQSIGSLTLGNLQGNGTTASQFTIGTAPSSLKVVPVVQLGSVDNYSFSSSAPIASLSAITWTNSKNVSEKITTTGLGSLSIAHDLEANLTVNNPGTGGAPMATTFLKSFTVGGALKDSVVDLNANVGTVKLGAMDGSEFLVGVAQSNGSPVIPAHSSDFVLPNSTIPKIAVKSFIITGSAPGETTGMTDSTVAAHAFGSISVNNVDTASAQNFGFIADLIGAYSRNGVKHALQPGENDQAGAYSVDILTS